MPRQQRPAPSPFGQKPVFEILVLANHVEALNGLLYMNGGGSTDHHRMISGGSPPPNSHLGIALMVLVPWNETNRPIPFAVEIQADDGEKVLAVDGQLNVGRPAMISPGADQHPVLAINVDTIFPRPGGYRVVATLR